MNRLVKKSLNFRQVLFLCFREAIEDYLVIFGLALLLALILGIELDTAGKNASRPFASGMECMIIDTCSALCLIYPNSNLQINASVITLLWFDEDF